MMGRYKWLVKVLSVGAECKGEDPNEHKMTTSTKQYNTTADPSSRTPDEKNKQRIQKPYYYSKDYKVFNDPIHGHMALHPVLVKIINTPEFQRLRNIKQLGGIYFVYPGASHNRFEHSIGVAHLSGELAKSLKKKQEEQIENLEEMKKLKTEQLKMLTELKNLKPEYLEELKKLKPEDLKELKKFQDLDPEKLEKLKKLKPEDLEVLQRFNPKDVEKMDNLEELKKSLISDQDVLCVQIAGLCHDLGHGPYSHFYDQMFMKAITDNKGKDFDSKWKHEHASIDMFHHILENTDGLTKMMEECGLEIKNGEKDGDDLMFIKDMIKETQEKSQNENNTDEQQSRKEKKPFLYEIVSNEETGIDVDKFDYLARDCQRLGIPNSFNHERFITFAGICCDENGRKHVCSREKELTNLYEIFHTRLSIHRRACQHRIKMAVEMMIKDALLLVDDHPDFKTMSSKGEMLSLSDSKKDMEAYVKLTDQVIENILNSSSKKSWWQIFGKEDARKLKDARKILQRVMTRDLYRCLGEATLKKKSQEEIKRSLSEVVKGIHEGEEVKVEDVTVSYRMENKEPICKTYDLKDSNEKGTGKTDQVEISEDMKEDLRRQLVNETGVSEDDFEVIEVIYDYGKENEDPISKAYFFRKDDPDKGIPLKKLKVSKLLPKCFSEKILRVYWKNPETNPGIIIKAKDCFEEWCKKNGFEMEKTDDDTGTSKK